jgi:hypothetical protein
MSEYMHDENRHEMKHSDLATCLTCKGTWCVICEPTPAMRCPFEYEHADEDTAAQTRGRGLVPRLGQVEAEALDAFGAAIWAANSVNEWATDRQGSPYFFADRALMEALSELYGRKNAEAIRYQVIDNGEPVSYNVCQFFGIEVTKSE